MNNNYTDITIVLDRSGSMESTRTDAEGGFNNFITEQNKLPGKCLVSLHQFDDKFETVYEGKPLSEVPKLSLIPRNLTALLDAVGRTVIATGDRLRKISETERPGKVIFIIITDGCENASKEYTREKVKELIEHQRTEYSWQFVFIGADANTFNEAQNLGILPASTFNYANTSAGTQSMYNSITKSTTNYRTGKTKDMTLNNKQN